MPYKMEFWTTPLQPYPYDPAKAKQLLAQAGYPHGFNTFLITVSGDVAGQAEAVVDQVRARQGRHQRRTSSPTSC